MLLLYELTTEIVTGSHLINHINKPTDILRLKAGAARMRINYISHRVRGSGDHLAKRGSSAAAIARLI